MLSSCTISFLPPVPKPESIVLEQAPGSDGYQLGFRFTSTIYMDDGSIITNRLTSVDSTGFTDIVDNGQAIRYGTAVIRSYITDYLTGSYVYSNPISITINNPSDDWSDGTVILNLVQTSYDVVGGQNGTWTTSDSKSGTWYVPAASTLITLFGDISGSYDFYNREIILGGYTFTR